MNKLNIDKFKKLLDNKIFRIRAVITIIIVFIIIILSLILKYNVEGETNLPFNLTKMSVISTATAEHNEDAENRWNLNLIQKNDFYFYIEKNPDYKKDISISSVTFDNFQITKQPKLGKINIYRPSETSILYHYTDEYLVNESLKYNAALSTNIAALEINNQGGLIGFSIALSDIGTYISNEDTEIVHDGTLLNKNNISIEDIEFEISFDLVIETSNDNKFKSTITLDLPTGNITEKGTSSIEKKGIEDIIFKRI